MERQKPKYLPLGASDFASLRQSDLVYVDKTAQIFELAVQPMARLFLSRPRRFGKSLLVSTFESLFKEGLKYFKGLAIEKLWREDKTYKVIHLDFSGIDPKLAPKNVHQTLVAHIYPSFREFGFEFDLDGNLNFYAELEQWLRRQEKTSFVLLIDEYDAPLTACLDSPDLFDLVRAEMAAFYSMVKKSDGAYRFVFITGIAKFAKVNVFSAMNNLRDISLMPQFGTLLGYTEQEVQEYFAVFLQKAASAANLSVEEVVTKMRVKYDGFCFDKLASTHVFSPWSTLNYLSDPDNEFPNYWFDSAGQPTMLLNYFKKHSFDNPADFFSEKDIAMEALSLSSGYEDADDKALMTQAGYLTIKNKKGNLLYVDYPNAEVRESIARLYAQRMLTTAGYKLVNNDDYKEVLAIGKGENIFTMFNRLNENLSYNFFRQPLQEYTLVSIYQLFMIGTGLEPRVEQESPTGRSDLQVTIGGRHLVIEFKVQRQKDTAKHKLQEAVNQIIVGRYGLSSSAEEIFRLALVYSEEKRRFVCWQEVP